MKHTYNQEIYTDFDSNLETIASSAIRSISPNAEHVHTWYTTRKPVHYTKSVRSKIYIPVFGSVFAGMCAFIMILSTQNSHTSQLAKLDLVDTVEIASFSEVSIEKTAIILPNESDQNVLSRLDSKLLATNRGSMETFLQETNIETLNTLFE